MMLQTNAKSDEVKASIDTAIYCTLSPTNNDVLCGRGKTHFFHEGNAKFREVVGKHLEDYLNAPTRPQKSQIVKDIADKILGQGSRFLRKKGKHDKWWYDGGVATARAKVRVQLVVESGICYRWRMPSPLNAISSLLQQVGHALRDASGSKSETIMNIHLEHMRSKSDAATHTFSSDIARKSEHGVAFTEGRTRLASNVARRAFLSEFARGPDHEGDISEFQRSDTSDDDDELSLEPKSDDELDSFCLGIELPEGESQLDLLHDESNVESRLSGVNFCCDVVWNSSSQFSLSLLSVSILSCPQFPPFLEESNFTDDDAVAWFLSDAFSPSQ